VKRVTVRRDIRASAGQNAAKLVLIGDARKRGAAEYLVRKKKLQKDVHFPRQTGSVYRLLSEADLFFAVTARIVWTGGARSDACEFQSSPQTSAACRK